MKFPEALDRFCTEITMQYGNTQPVLKIAIPKPIFDQVAMEIFSDSKYGGHRMAFGFQEISDGLIINGVRIVRREREDF